MLIFEQILTIFEHKSLKTNESSTSMIVHVALLLLQAYGWLIPRGALLIQVQARVQN